MNKNKKLLIIICICVLLITVASAAYLLFHTNKSGNNESSGNVQQETINFDSPSDEEIVAGDDKKSQIENDESESDSDNSANPNDKKTVTPIITSAGQYGDQIEVRAFVPNIYEANGTCIVTFTNNNDKIERQVEGIQDATTTRCDTVTILREDFPSSGTWTVRVAYSSPSSQGESDVTSFEVQ